MDQADRKQHQLKRQQNSSGLEGRPHRLEGSIGGGRQIFGRKTQDAVFGGQCQNRTQCGRGLYGIDPGNQK